MFTPFLTLDQDPDGSGSGPSQSVGQQGQQDFEKLYKDAQSKLDATEKRRIGLQQTYQTEQDTHKATKDVLSQLQATLATLTGEKSTLADQLSKLEVDGTEKEIELETLRRGDKRAKLIFKSFLELAPFEADGLIPEAEEDKLEELFTGFSKKLGELKDKAKVDFGTGGTPPPPPPKPEPDENRVTLLKQLSDAALSGNRKVYNELFDKYMKAAEKS